MEITDEQIREYVGALVAAGIDPASFGEFMVRSKLFMELRGLETGLDILARQRSEAMAQFDAQEAACGARSMRSGRRSRRWPGKTEGIHRFHRLRRFFRGGEDMRQVKVIGS